MRKGDLLPFWWQMPQKQHMQSLQPRRQSDWGLLLSESGRVWALRRMWAPPGEDCCWRGEWISKVEARGCTEQEAHHCPGPGHRAAVAGNGRTWELHKDSYTSGFRCNNPPENCACLGLTAEQSLFTAWTGFWCVSHGWLSHVALCSPLLPITLSKSLLMYVDF